MATFTEANRVRAGVKMLLSNFSWFEAARVVESHGDHIIVVHTSKLDNAVRRTVPVVIDGIEVRTECYAKI
jgi:hypothetical protein